ncbi:unnamed protein product [Closterium sp. NIES-53]
MPRAQRESGHKVKVIRTDNGGEFIGADFEAVLKKKGIQHQLTVPYKHQQNGVAEHFNRTLQEGARILLGRAGLPDPFWVTALRQVALVKNRVLATVGDKQWVPYTKWYGSAPAFNMLRAYGCMVVRAGSVAGQCDEDEIAHCYWAAVPEPKTLAEALSGPDAEKWKQSVKEEYESLLENETWELCELPLGKKAISSKLIFRHKYGPDGELTRYKSRLVAKGFQQTKGKDFDEIFAPVGKGTSLGVMLGTAANRGWRIKQMDITTAFLNGIILEELYMLQPEGLDDGSGRVCRLKKAIYGLKQAPRAWYHKLEETLLAGGFKKSECDHSLFLLQEKEQFLMLLVYVDDILLLSESSAMIKRVEEMLEMQFKCSKIGDVKYYLGMHVERDLYKGVLRLHKRKYCEGLAEKYGLQDGGKPATPLPSGFTVEPCADEEVVGESDRKLFHSMVGALNYATNHTQPDIAFATSRLASVVSRPTHEQLEAAKRLVRYVSATASVGLEYSAVRQRLQRGAADLSKGEMLLTCYTDASFNSVKADGTSIGGYVCLFVGGAVSWRSKKQNEVGLSSCETEYMALHHGVKEVVWLRHFLEEIGVCQREPTVMTTLAALGIAPSSADPSPFLRTDTTRRCFYILVYVDDLVFATADTEAQALVKAELQERHTCTDLEPIVPYPKLVGCLMYLMTCTRPGLAYPLSLLARYVAPGRHRKGSVVLTGHSDTSWADDQATQRSCKAEIYAGAMAAQELCWLTYLLTDLGDRPRSPPVLYVDNKAMLALCHEQRLEHRTKHIALRYFLAHELH